MENDRQELFDDMVKSRQEMQALLDDLADDLEIYENWTRKEVIAHLTGWEDATLNAARSHLSHSNLSPLTAYRGIDIYNEQSVRERLELSYEQISREWNLARQNLIELMQEMTPEQYTEKITLPWGGKCYRERGRCLCITYP